MAEQQQQQQQEEASSTTTTITTTTTINHTIIYEFNNDPNNYIQQLYKLFQNEWWTNQRTLDETRRLIIGSQITIGIIIDDDDDNELGGVVTANDDDDVVAAVAGAPNNNTKATTTETTTKQQQSKLQQQNKKKLIGFGRVLTDYTIKAFIFDIIVDKQYRNYGLGKCIMNEILNHPQLVNNVKHFELYCIPKMENFYRQQFGFLSSTDDGSSLSNITLMRKTM